jgi:hypothetical protein
MSTAGQALPTHRVTVPRPRFKQVPAYPVDAQFNVPARDPLMVWIRTNPSTMTKYLLPGILACSTFMSTQTIFAQGPIFGVKGGLNYSTLAVDEADDETSRWGYNLGVFARTAPQSPIGLQIELLYSTKGSTTTYSTLFGLIEQDVDFNLNYLELPVLASFRFGELVELQVGAYAAYLLSASISSSGDLGTSNDQLDREDFSAMDFGIAGGVGFNLGPNTQLGVRYLHGMTNIADSDGADFVLGDSKNRCVQLYVGFGIGGK